MLYILYIFTLRLHNYFQNEKTTDTIGNKFLQVSFKY